MNKPVSINIDDWLAGKHPAATNIKLEPARDEDLTPEQLAEVKERRAQLDRENQRMSALLERSGLTEDAPRECTECGMTEVHYTDDYVCFQCRDKLDA